MITYIKIKNFKGIIDAEIHLSALNVLIGANGAGKTTFLEAIDFIKKAVVDEDITKAAKAHAISIGEDFSNYISSETLSSYFELNIQTRQSDVFKYSLSVRPNQRDGLNSLVIENEKLSLINNNVHKTIFDRKSIISQGEIFFSNNEIPFEISQNKPFLSTFKNVDIDSVVSTLSNYEIIWADANLDNRNNKERLIDLSNPGNTIDDALMSLYSEEKTSYQQAMKDISTIIPGFQKPKIVDISSHFENDSIEKKQKNKEPLFFAVRWATSNKQDSGYSSRFSLSGGNLRIIYLIIKLYSAKPGSCFAIEEIENGLHSARISKLSQKIISIAKKRKVQLMISSHSYLLTSETLPRDIIFCESKDNAGSKYTKLSEMSEFRLVQEALEKEPTSSEILDSGLISFGE